MCAKLFEPITLRGLDVRNRSWVPPMCQYSAVDGLAADWHLVHYGGLARGGAGAIIVEATGVVPEGRISPTDLGLWSEAHAAALQPTVDFVHGQGAAIGIQLAHSGRKGSVWPETGAWGEVGSMPLDRGGWQTVAPSPIPYPDMAMPRELTTTEISALVRAFAAAADRAVEAGFDFVEIHGAHGYLLHEFLSPISNQRTDQYGGSLANRSRFLLEVVDQVRATVPDRMPVLVRLSAIDWLDDGLQLEDTVQLGHWLADHGVDLIDVSSGAIAPAPIPSGPGYQLPFAEVIRRETGLPTAAVGLISEPLQAEQILTSGQADVVLLGRASMRDPHFPLHAAKALGHDLDYIPVPYLRAFR